MKTIIENHDTEKQQELNSTRVMNSFRMAMVLQELSDTLIRAGVTDRIDLSIVDFDRENCLLNCVGDIPSEILDFMKETGEQFSMPENWINTNCCMPYNSIKNLEKTVGQLHFEKNVDNQIGIFNLNFLADRDLLRVKLIMIETEFLSTEYGGDFSRFSDIRDLLELKSSLNIDYIEMERLADGFLLSSEVFDVISSYEIEGEDGVNKLVAEFQKDADIEKDIKVLITDEKSFDTDERDM